MGVFIGVYTPIYRGYPERIGNGLINRRLVKWVRLPHPLFINLSGTAGRNQLTEVSNLSNHYLHLEKWRNGIAADC